MSPEAADPRATAAEGRRPWTLVTGGGRRLGRRIALSLAAQGYDVALTAHSDLAAAHRTAAEVRAVGAECLVVEIDLREPTRASNLIQQVEQTAGPISLLVNNAAVFPRADVETSDAEVFDSTIALNLRAPYLLSLECGRRMRARGAGSIVNLASVGGMRPYVQHIPYSISKAGLIMLTRALAAALAPKVRVNAVAPGTIWIDGEEEGAAAKPMPQTIPLGAYGRAADVTQAVLYLANAPFVTGEVLVVDGGVSVRTEHP